MLIKGEECLCLVLNNRKFPLGSPIESPNCSYDSEVAPL